jgi:hypothetical protein
MGRYAIRELHPLSEIAVIDQATIDLIASEIPPSGLTISQVKADTDIADSLTKKHSHTNKTTLDSVQEALTTVLKGNYDTAYSHSQTVHLQFTGLAKITVGTTQPSNPSVGDLWIDTN